MEDQDTIERAPSAADSDAARAVVQRVMTARRAEADARAERRAFIVDQYQRGTKVIEIARKLGAMADELNMDPRERARFGVSESSVHNELRVAGVK